MNNTELLDIYSDYLLSAFGRTTSTGLSELLDGQLSHDQIQRFLNGREFTSADLWGMVKGAVRQMESSGGSLIIDDSIVEKPYMGENSLVCWHYDHSSGSTVKGINFISTVYHSQGQTLPVGFRLVEKDEWYDGEDGERKRRSRVSKNSHYQALLKQAVANWIPFKYVLNDVWYASAENMRFVVETLDKDFVMPLKANRKVALSAEDKKRGRYVRIDSLTFEPNTCRIVYLEGLPFALVLAQQVFVNEDGSTGILYLVSSDLDLTYDQLTGHYRTRWSIEPYHKSLKQNVSLEKSPAQTKTGQTNHLVAALFGYIKLELLRAKTNLTHFGLKARLYLSALKTAYAQLRLFQHSSPPA